MSNEAIKLYPAEIDEAIKQYVERKHKVKVDNFSFVMQDGVVGGAIIEIAKSMKDRIKAMLVCVNSAVKGTMTPKSLKKLLKDLDAPHFALRIDAVKAFLESKLIEIEESCHEK